MSEHIISSGGATNQTPGLIPEGRSVEPGRGLSWISEGWALFVKSPGIWIAQILLLVVLNFVLALIPVLGMLVLNLITPLFAAGFLHGCRSLSNGGTLQFDHLFEGFKTKTSQLIIIGVFLLIGGIIMAAIIAATTGSAALGVFSGRMDASAGFGAMALGILIAMAISVPIMMAVWFAIPLVFFHDVAPVEALKHSFFACLKNIVPFLVYGVVTLILMILAAIPLGLGFFVLAPVLMGSFYASYLDVFVGDSKRV